jgi:hypothetical protein
MVKVKIGSFAYRPDPPLATPLFIFSIRRPGHQADESCYGSSHHMCFPTRVQKIHVNTPQSGQLTIFIIFIDISIQSNTQSYIPSPFSLKSPKPPAATKGSLCHACAIMFVFIIHEFTINFNQFEMCRLPKT